MNELKKKPSKKQLNRWINGALSDATAKIEMIIGILSITIILYLISVYLFPSNNTRLYFTIIMTISNIMAILFSWIYFNATKCFGNEMNPVTRYGMSYLGEDFFHIILFIGRILLNIFFIYMLFTDDNLFEPYYFFDWIIYPNIILYSFITSIWMTEAIVNIFQNIEWKMADKPIEYVCNDINEICKTTGKFCDEAEILNQLNKKK